MTIYQMKCLLGYLGYLLGNVDDKADGFLLDAIIDFQDDYGLNKDGICGPVTQKALTGAVAGMVTKPKPKDFP